jgi:hypothetical protein
MQLVALSDKSGELELELRGIEAGIELRAERLLEGANSELEEEVFKLNTRLASVRARSDVNRKAQALARVNAASAGGTDADASRGSNL